MVLRSLPRVGGWLLVLCLVSLLGSTSWAVAGQEVLDLNKADVAELARLPGIGPVRAQAIVERRQAVPFARVEELLAIRGIGDATFAGLRERVQVGESPGATQE